MRSVYDQSGFTDRMMLVAFAILFVVAVIALPKYLKWRETSKVPAEVISLRRVYVAQTKYRTRISIKDKYADLKTLIETNQIEPQPAFEINLNYEETRFCVSLGKYAVNADGKIYESETVGCSMGEVTGSNLKEILGAK